MKKLNLVGILTFLLLLQIVLFAGAFIQFFHASNSGDNIVLAWQTTDETNVKEFEILRGADKDHLAKITSILAKGSNSVYSFTDENAYKTNDSFYAYALVIVDKDGTRSEPMFAFVTHNGVSSVKRTWGSIKALFR